MDKSKLLALTFNPSTSEGQRQLQTEGVELISRIPYGGVDCDPEPEEEHLDEFLCGVKDLFFDTDKITNPDYSGQAHGMWGDCT